MESNIDLKLEIRKVLKSISSCVEFIHVKSHQDEECLYDDPPLPARLNVDADELTRLQYEKLENKHKKTMPHLDTQVISMTSRHSRLTNNIGEEFIRLRRDYFGEKAALKSWKIRPELAQSVDWEALHFNMSSWKFWERGSAIKCLHRLWDTGLRKYKWKQSHTNLCVACEQCVETCDHILKCQCMVVKKAREFF